MVSKYELLWIVGPFFPRDVTIAWYVSMHITIISSPLLYHRTMGAFLLRWQMSFSRLVITLPSLRYHGSCNLPTPLLPCPLLLNPHGAFLA